MRLHLDTTFLIDAHRRDERVLPLLEQIIAGAHEVSIDPIVETEFFAAKIVEARKRAVFASMTSLGRVLPLTSNVCRLAGSWLAPMDRPQRRARFADSLVAAVAYLESATLVTGDTKIAGVFPVAVLQY